MGWFRNFFNRNKPVEHVKVTEDWTVGDMAECINQFGWGFVGLGKVAGPAYGEVRQVAAVDLEVFVGEPGKTGIGLAFNRYGPQMYHANLFRKIEPRADKVDRKRKASLDDLMPARKKELTE